MTDLLDKETNELRFSEDYETAIDTLHLLKEERGSLAEFERGMEATLEKFRDAIETNLKSALTDAVGHSKFRPALEEYLEREFQDVLTFVPGDFQEFILRRCLDEIRD